MSIDKISILVQGWEWPVGTDIDEINFFSDVIPTAITSEIDLMDYILDKDNNGISELKYDFDKVEPDGASASGVLFFTSGSINLRVTDGEINGLKMSDFFKIFEDTQRIKYKGKLFYDGALLFQFTVHQDGLKTKFALADKNSHVVDILAVGMEKEFRDYFSNKNLPATESVPWLWDGVHCGLNNIITSHYPTRPPASSDDSLYYKVFTTVVESLFENAFITNYNYDNDVTEWFVGMDARFIKSEFTNGLHHNRQGYDRLTKSGLSRLKWFECTLNSMGWIYFILADTFYIKNRSGFELPVTEIDYSSIHADGFEAGKRKPALTYDYIMFLSGAYYGGDTFMLGGGIMKGERPVILTNKTSLYKNTNHWNTISGTVNSSYEIDAAGGYIFTKYHHEDSETFYISNITSVDDYETKGIPQSKILRIDTGAAQTMHWSRVVGWAGNDGAYDKAADSPTLGDEDMGYTGCCGDQMMKIIQGAQQLQNYSGRYGADGYVNTQQFINNFAKFWDNRTNHYMTVKLIGLITNPLQNFKFINSGQTFFDNAEFGIQTLKLNLVEELTELELLKVN
jgi:hypothetical protein